MTTAAATTCLVSIQIKTSLERDVDLFHLLSSGGSELVTEPRTNHPLDGRDHRPPVITDTLSKDAFWIMLDEVDSQHPGDLRGVDHICTHHKTSGADPWPRQDGGVLPDLASSHGRRAYPGGYPSSARASALSWSASSA